MATFSASAPGKVILFGEHAVVHGASCIAASIDLRTSATVHLCDDCFGGSLAGEKAERNNSLITDQIIITLPGLDLEWHWQLEELGPIIQALNGKEMFGHRICRQWRLQWLGLILSNMLVYHLRLDFASTAHGKGAMGCISLIE
jgi:hypothetical protein